MIRCVQINHKFTGLVNKKKFLLYNNNTYVIAKYQFTLVGLYYYYVAEEGGGMSNSISVK